MLPTYSQVPDCKEAIIYQATSDSPLFSFDAAHNKISIFGSDVTYSGIFTISIKGIAAISKTEKEIAI